MTVDGKELDDRPFLQVRVRSSTPESVMVYARSRGLIWLVIFAASLSPSSVDRNTFCILPRCSVFFRNVSMMILSSLFRTVKDR